MIQVIIKLIGAVLVLLGIILIYDARVLTKRFFGFGDQNDATQRIKNIGVHDCYCGWINYIFYIKYKDIANMFEKLLIS